MQTKAGPFANLPSYPAEWCEVQLETLAAVNSESLGGDTSPRFKFCYIDIASVDKGVIDWSAVTTQVFSTAPSRARRIVRPNDVLLCTVRPALQSHMFADWRERDGYICSTGFAVLRAREKTEPRYLYHLIFSEAVVQQIRRLESGSNYPAIGETDIGLLRVPKPSPLEQHRIAEILDTVDVAIQRTEALIAKLKQMKAGLLHDLLTRGLDAHGHLRDPLAHPEQFKDSPLGRIPQEWEVDALGTIAEIGSGVTLGRNLEGPGTVELPYLRVANVQDGYLDLDEIKTIRVRKEEIPRFLLQPGDVLMNEGGDFDKLGRGAVWLGQISPCLHQNHVFRVRVNGQKLRPEFLTAVSGSAYGKRFFILSSKQSTNLASINSTQLKSFPVPHPLVEEQDQILSIINTHDTRLNAEDSYCDKLKQLKKGLMADLLTGRVRVRPGESAAP